MCVCVCVCVCVHMYVYMYHYKTICNVYSLTNISCSMWFDRSDVVLSEDRCQTQCFLHSLSTPTSLYADWTKIES